MRTASESTYSKPTTSKPTIAESTTTNPTGSKPTIAVQRTFNDPKTPHAALSDSLQADNHQVDYLNASLPKLSSTQVPTKAIIDADAIPPAKAIINAAELRAIV